LNADNSIRSRVTSAILNAKRLKGFTPAEEAMLENVPEGSVAGNTKRYLSNFLGGGGGLGAHLATAAGIVGGKFAGLGDLSWAMGPILPAIGAGLKRSAGKSTGEALQEVQQATRQRSPLFREMPPQDIIPDEVYGRDAMARALMRMEGQSDQGVPLTPEPPPTTRLVVRPEIRDQEQP
jgi:hypothetical protein